MGESIKLTLLRAYQVLLGPLIRILLRQGISYAEFSEIAKAVYVEVALKDFKVAGRKATRTRVAVMTGLTRKEVKRVIDEAVKERYEPKSKFSRFFKSSAFISRFSKIVLNLFGWGLGGLSIYLYSSYYISQIF